MNVIHTSRLQKSGDLHGIFYSFSPVLHEWLKTGHTSFTTRQLFPVAFLSVYSLLDGTRNTARTSAHQQHSKHRYRMHHFSLGACILASGVACKTQEEPRQLNPNPTSSRAGTLSITLESF